ncbi:MAG TPA: hypothetical protein VKP61_11125 [Candidatus Acidoferrum sp.]|nr:hypothetical protein [Candidatus Acidoferrum sp.]
METETLIQEETLAHLREKFADCWMRGAEWRLEVGELLYKIKEKCEYSEWGDFLKEYDLPRSTADDYVRRYRDEAGLTEVRQFDEPNPEPKPDPQAEERKQDIEVEKNKRKGKRPEHNPTQVQVRLRSLLPHQTAVYWEERKENCERVDAIWRAAFFQIIGAEQVYPPLNDEEVTAAAVAAEEEACSAS